MKKVLVTGTAGFIGMHTALRIRKEGYSVTGIDNINDYYSTDLKLARLREQGIPVEEIVYNKRLSGKEGLNFMKLDITDAEAVNRLFIEEQFDYVVHLAAQAGVRYSIENPKAYIESNINGFMNILEACRHNRIKHLVYASSSSVYGMNKKIPFEETDQTEQQVSLYAATKKANESMAHSYASVHGLPVTGLRFFTVYGPYGRPDMAIFKFTKSILSGKPIDVYNKGNLMRDFTYIDDIVNGITSLLEAGPEENKVPYALYNIGRGKAIPLMEFIEALEQALGLKAQLNMMPMQPGDVEKTWASTKALNERVGYEPQTSVQDGVVEFVKWYKSYHGNNN